MSHPLVAISREAPVATLTLDRDHAFLLEIFPRSRALAWIGSQLKAKS